MKYDLEARAKTQKGTVTVGSREGYAGKEFDLNRVEEAVDKANLSVRGQGFNPVPCIISQGRLIGRAGVSGGGNAYREGVYRLEFALSPRVPAMNKKNFYKLIVAYATEIGETLKQERVYVEFDGWTSVLKARE